MLWFGDFCYLRIFKKLHSISGRRGSLQWSKYGNKKNRDSPTKIHWSEGAIFEMRFVENNNVNNFFEK
jgi:hypothetical protein